MKNNWKVISSAVVCTILSLVAGGCANLSTLQTARVEPPKEFKLTLGAGYASISSSSLSGLGLPYVTGMGRWGLAENLDMGVKATLFGTLGVDAKYQFVNMDRLAMAVGLGAGIFSLSLGSMYQITIPLYVSYDFSDSFSLYSAPRFTAGLSSVTFTSGSSTVTGIGTATYVGGGLGFKAGKKMGVLAEGSFQGSLNTNYPNLLEFDAAFFVGL